MTPLFRERWGPYILALVVAVGWWFLGRAFPKDATNLLLATGTTAAVLVGFVATVMAIILSITGSAVFRALRSSGYHNDLFRYLFEAIVAGTLFLVLALVGFFLSEPVTPEPYNTPELYRLAWVLIGSTTLFVFLRVFVLVFRLLRQA